MSVPSRARHLAGTLAAGLALSLFAVTPAHAALFGPAHDFATGGNGGPGWEETSLAVADFDGDGRQDVVTADYFNYFTTSPGPLLQRNLGGGAFQSPGTRVFPAGTGSTAYEIGSVAAGDLNRDGKQDLVVTNDAQLSVLLGNANGTFQAPLTTSVIQGGQDDIAITDANNDGNPDVVVLLRTGARTFLGNGTGALPTSVTSTFGSFAMSGIDVADFDHDGRVDLAATDAGAQRIIALKGNGAGGFTQFASVPSYFVPGTAFVGDFNEDGLDDVAASNEFNGGVHNVAVAMNNGHGGFGPTTLYDGGFGPAAGAVGDVNGDGHTDIVSSDTVLSQEDVLLGTGTGTFTDGGSYDVSTFPQTPVIADLDGDGRADLAVGGAGKTGYGGAYGTSQLTILTGTP